METPNFQETSQQPSGKGEKKEKKERDRTAEREKSRLRKQKERDLRKAEKSRLKRERGDDALELILQPTEEEMAPKKKQKTKPAPDFDPTHDPDYIPHEMTEDGCAACEEEILLTGMCNHNGTVTMCSPVDVPFTPPVEIPAHLRSANQEFVCPLEQMPSPWVPLALGFGGLFAYHKSPVIKEFINKGWAIIKDAHSAVDMATNAKEQLEQNMAKNLQGHGGPSGSSLDLPARVVSSTSASV